MEYTIFVKTKEYLQEIAETNPAILVAFSGGKDSWVCLDLCMKTFQRVKPFFMYFIPGLECVEIELRKAEQKYGVDILRLPHWLFFSCVKAGLYCDTHWKDADGIWNCRVNDIYRIAIAETGIPIVCQGAKKSDSLFRRQKFFSFNKFENTIYPIKEWRKIDVLSYMKMNDLEMPDSTGGSTTGVDLSASSLLWLHDKYPNDFRKILTYFPYAEAIVYRREYYGKKEETGGVGRGREKPLRKV